MTVFPTPVGVFPARIRLAVELSGLPHARGGVSSAPGLVDATGESSPRPWGCFQSQAQGYRQLLVFPTPVGVFPW